MLDNMRNKILEALMSCKTGTKAGSGVKRLRSEVIAKAM